MSSLIAILSLSYLIGSIPGSLWAGKLLYSIDLREHGSGNAGATNAFRVLGWKAGLMATAVDLGKGLFAAGVVPFLVGVSAVPHLGFSAWETTTVACLLAGIVAVIGHMFPIWANFRGGKGMNTSAGVLFALTPVTTLIALGVFVLVLVMFRYVSLASIMAAVAFPSAVAIRRYVFGIEGLDPSLLILGILLALGIIVAHRANIQRLLQGDENRVRSFRPARGMRGRGEL